MIVMWIVVDVNRFEFRSIEAIFTALPSTKIRRLVDNALPCAKDQMTNIPAIAMPQYTACSLPDSVVRYRAINVKGSRPNSNGAIQADTIRIKYNRIFSTNVVCSGNGWK